MPEGEDAMNATEQERAQQAMREKVAADQSGPATGKEPGDPQWCWQKVGLLQVDWGLLDTSFNSYIETLALIDEHKVWEKIPEDEPFGTRERMLGALAIGDEDAARRELSDQLKRKALQTKALREQGRPHKGEDSKPVLAQVYGTGKTDYLLARIKRDRPDVFERVLNGEFTSSAEAARAAGIVRNRTRSISLGSDVGRLASALSKHYTPEEFAELSRRMLQLRRQGRQSGAGGN